MSASTASIIIQSARQDKSRKPVETLCFSNCSRDTSEAAVGLLGMVMDSFSFELDFELWGRTFPAGQGKKAQQEQEHSLNSETEAESVECSGEQFGKVSGVHVPGTVRAQRPPEI